jgi:hypothetical protein
MVRLALMSATEGNQSMVDYCNCPRRGQKVKGNEVELCGARRDRGMPATHRSTETIPPASLEQSLFLNHLRYEGRRRGLGGHRPASDHGGERPRRDVVLSTRCELACCW